MRPSLVEELLLPVDSIWAGRAIFFLGVVYGWQLMLQWMDHTQEHAGSTNLDLARKLGVCVNREYVEGRHNQDILHTTVKLSEDKF